MEESYLFMPQSIIGKEVYGDRGGVGDVFLFAESRRESYRIGVTKM